MFNRKRKKAREGEKTGKNGAGRGKRMRAAEEETPALKPKSRKEGKRTAPT